ncbi:thermonuclease family protein [Patescibacteria group bacterium]|nr:thermonuclease family protein [Patescibacteria group bacterium]
MIVEGYAFEYTYQTPYKYQREFQQAENEARATKRGLWSDNTCAGSLTTLTPTPEPAVSTPMPAPSTPTTKPPATTCDCSGNIYNCPDFATHSAAQTCFEHCGGIDNDIHGLDADKDGIACENLP